MSLLDLVRSSSANEQQEVLAYLVKETLTRSQGYPVEVASSGQETVGLIASKQALAKVLPLPKLSAEEIERIRNITRHNTNFIPIDEFIAKIPDDM
jgi:CheY-like chemotaxis protein